MFITVYELDDIHRTEPKYLNINKIFLEVSENNIIAKLLYENQGFKEIYRRENYYKDGSCAIIMEKFI